MKKVRLITIATATVLLFSSLLHVADVHKVKADKVTTYQVAVSNASKPLSYSQNGKLKGYEVDTLRKVDQELPNAKFKYHAVSQSAELVGLDSGKYDLAVNGFYKNPEREKKYLFGKENDGLSLVRIYYNKQQFTKSVTDLKDLEGKELAPVNANGGMYNLLTAWNKDHGNRIKVKTTNNGIPMQQLLTGVNTGKYDALIDPSNLGESTIIKQRQLNNIKESKPVRAFPTYILFAKGQQKLADQVDTALETLKDNGQLKKLSQQYLSENIFNYHPKTK